MTCPTEGNVGLWWAFFQVVWKHRKGVLWGHTPCPHSRQTCGELTYQANKNPSYKRWRRPFRVCLYQSRRHFPMCKCISGHKSSTVDIRDLFWLPTVSSPMRLGVMHPHAPGNSSELSDGLRSCCLMGVCCLGSVNLLALKIWGFFLVSRPLQAQMFFSKPGIVLEWLNFAFRCQLIVFRVWSLFSVSFSSFD